MLPRWCDAMEGRVTISLLIVAFVVLLFGFVWLLHVQYSTTNNILFISYKNWVLRKSVKYIDGNREISESWCIQSLTCLTRSIQTKADIAFRITTREYPWSSNCLKSIKRSRTLKSRNRVVKAHLYFLWLLFCIYIHTMNKFILREKVIIFW